MKLTVLILGIALICQSACSLRGAVGSGQLNEEAALAANIPYNPLNWKVITTSIDRQAGAMSTLFGNDLAVRHARTASNMAYPQGSILSLVTWAQREDPHWFGAKIPGPIKTVEFAIVEFNSEHKPSVSYESYEGPELKRKTTVDAGLLKARIESITGRRASVMP
jgi:hypothetical protein